MPQYPLTTAALLLALFVYVGAVMAVGQARGRFKIEAPATTGHPVFERLFRAQQNTVEQIILFLPVLGLAAATFGDRVAGSFGLLWSLARILYIITYAKGANRAAGFLLSAGASLAMLIAVGVKLAIGG
ncbi:MAG: MAPEG family protein [Sphingomicrobium sp.]